MTETGGDPPPAHGGPAAPDGFAAVLTAGALGPGQTAPVTVSGRSVLLCRTSEGLVAVENVCTHAGEALTGGRLRDCQLACPHHGARFDLRDGRSLTPLTAKPLTRFPVRERQGQIEVRVPPPPPKAPLGLGTPLGPRVVIKGQGG